MTRPLCPILCQQHQASDQTPRVATYSWSTWERVCVLRQLCLDISNNIRYQTHHIEGQDAEGMATFFHIMPKEADLGLWLCTVSVMSSTNSTISPRAWSSENISCHAGCIGRWCQPWAYGVKTLQGLGMLGVSVVLCVQESVVQWFEVSDEGTSPS